MTALTTPEQIEVYRLMTLRQGVKLEARGLMASYSANAAACRVLGLPKGTRRTKTLAALNEAIAARLAALEGGAE